MLADAVLSGRFASVHGRPNRGGDMLGTRPQREQHSLLEQTSKIWQVVEPRANEGQLAGIDANHEHAISWWMRHCGLPLGMVRSFKVVVADGHRSPSCTDTSALSHHCFPALLLRRPSAPSGDAHDCESP